MTMTPADFRKSFVKPAIIIDGDGNRSIKPRQKLKPGMLCKVEYHRVSNTHRNIENLGPKGNYHARVLAIGESNGQKVATVRILTDGYLLRENNYPLARVKMLHPDDITDEAFLTYARGIRSMAKRSMLSKLRERQNEAFLAQVGSGWNPSSERRIIVGRVTQYNYWVNAWNTYRVAVRKGWVYGAHERLMYAENPEEFAALKEYKLPDGANSLRSRAREYLLQMEALRRIGVRAKGMFAQLRALKTGGMTGVELSNGIATIEEGVPSKIHDVFQRKVLELFGLEVKADCGHYTTQVDTARVVVSVRYGTTSYATRCAHCIATATRPLFNPATERHEEMPRYVQYEGEWYDRSHVTFHTWEDGVSRPTAPPPVINGYHSSRQYHTKPLPNPDGTKATTLPYLGVELEFIGSGNATRSHEDCARDMHKAVKEAFDWVKPERPYMLFERDGSVDFEMVTGYGPIATHREAMLAMFKGNPYRRDLRSHDGGRCGIHVHLDKPKSLLHAVKLVKFWNDENNRPLIECVARRYSSGSGYAQACPGKGDIKRVVKDAYGDYRDRVGEQTRRIKTKSLREQITKDAIRRLNDAGQGADRGSRYVLCNFQNEKTVELRGFRGSLRVQTIIACLEFALMSWYFSRDTEPHLLTSAQFVAFINMPKWRHETRYLRQYLAQKNWPGVWMPRPNQQALPTPSASSNEVLEGIDETNNPY